MPRCTTEARQKQADQARQIRPWRHATGPRTDAGKAVSRDNAARHGCRSAGFRNLCAALRCASRNVS